MTINLNTLSVGPNGPMRNAHKFTERENRYMARENRLKTQEQERDNLNQRLDMPMEIDPPMDMDATMDKDLLEATRPTPLVAQRKLPPNSDERRTEHNNGKKNSNDDSYQQEKRYRDQKETRSYPNIKRTNDWDRSGKREGTYGQQSNYSYDRDRQMNDHQRGDKYDNNEHQHQQGTRQKNQGQDSYIKNQETPINNPARYNFQAPPQQRYDEYKKHQQEEPKGYQNQYRQGTANFTGTYRGRGSYNNRGYQRGFNRKGIIKYVAMPRILYDQICENETCKAPDAIVHHKEECPRLRNDEHQTQTSTPPQGF